MAKFKIAHFGAFDHDSYGDLLFPILLEASLGANWEIVHVSPYALPVNYADARKTISIDDALARTDWDGVVLGGGDLIGCSRWSPAAWARKEAVKGSTLSNLWAAAALLSLKLRIPFVWNAPGAPMHNAENYLGEMRELMASVSYASVRDEDSRIKVSGLGVNAIAVPDSALLVSDVWPVESVCEDRIVMCWAALDYARRHDEIKGAVAELVRAGKRLSFVPLMNWQSPALLQEVPLFEATSIESIARQIGGSEGYIGSSLHGLITAISYERRAILVAPKGGAKSHKYKGFLEQCGLDASLYLTSDWADAVRLYGLQSDYHITAAKKRVQANYENISKAINSGRESSDCQDAAYEQKRLAYQNLISGVHEVVSRGNAGRPCNCKKLAKRLVRKVLRIWS